MKILLKIVKLFSLILFSQLIIRTNSTLSFTYPTAASLPNGNIFVVEKFGIYICDSTFSNILSTEFNFTNEEDQIKNVDDLSKVLIKRTIKYIFLLVNYKLYVFNGEGRFLYNSLDKLISVDTPEYCSITFLGIDNNNYLYIIAYLDVYNYLNLLYYKYNILYNNNILITNKKDNLFTLYDFTYLDYYNYKFQNKGVSCEYIFEYYNGEVFSLVCFFVIESKGKEYLIQGYYSIGSTSITNNFNFENDYYNIENIKFIKSDRSYDKKRALVCFVKTNNNTYCFKFSIFEDYGLFYESSYFTKKCRNEIYALKVSYLYETKQIIFSCADSDGSIQVAFYGQDLLIPYFSYKQFNECELIFGYSIIYRNITSDYYIVSDVLCNNIHDPFVALVTNAELTLEENLENKEYILEEEQEKKEEELEEEKIETKEKIKEEREEERQEKEMEEEIRENEIEQKNEIKEEQIKKEEKLEDEIDEDTEEEIKDKNENNYEENKKEEMEKSEEKEIDNIIEEEQKEEQKEKTFIECNMLEKCSECNEESISKNLCLNCNKVKSYYPLNLSSQINSLTYLTKYNGYVECVNESTKPNNFYLNLENEDYEKCYETCSTCKYKGDGNENNCTSCEENFIQKPDYSNSSNCVSKCNYFYYYTIYNQYKCTASYECPEEYNLLIQKKFKCTNNCTKDEIYKYKYKGECLSECPNNTKDNNDYICKDININKCLLSENKYYSLIENITDDEIEKLARKYAQEFSYTDNHVSLFKNNIYTITFYKNEKCISDLFLQIPEIDFGYCYQKIKNNFQISQNLIIAIVDKKEEGSNYHKMISYSIFEPKEGAKLNADNICKYDNIIIKENILNKLSDTKLDINSLLYLTDQNIDIFNLSSTFYTDICYHYNSNIDKDIALKDRILIYFPNITLCEDDCEIIGVNVSKLKIKCECKFNSFKENNILTNNIFYQSQIGQIEEIISNTNIYIIKCFRDIFQYKYFIRCTGGFIILSIIFLQIVITIIYCYNNVYYIRKYIFSIANKYTIYLTSSKYNNMLLNSSLINNELEKRNEPPKKKKNIENEIFNELEGQKKLRPYRRKRKTAIDKKINIFINSSNDNTKNPNINNNLFLNNNIINNSLDNKSKLRMKRKTKSIIIKDRSFEDSPNLSNNILNKHKSYEQNDFFINNFKNNFDFNIEKYLSTEVDDMDYDDAVRKDKRKMFSYFCDKLKSNQIILNTFCYKEPLKPKTIKIILFLLQIDLYFFVNGLFFNEEYVSKIFHLEKDSLYDILERFIYNCFYASLVGVIINYLIEFFFINEKKVKGILRREKDNLLILKYEIVQLFKNIKYRYLYFIIISFIITFFTWYHISCFNNIYPHMKKEWLIFSILIIFFAQILSVLACFLESIFRFIGFKCKSEKIYKVSLLFS